MPSAAGPSSAEPTTAIDDSTIAKDEPTTESSLAASTVDTSKSMRAVADPSFKEMPYTFLPPDDPALIACM